MSSELHKLAQQQLNYRPRTDVDMIKSLYGIMVNFGTTKSSFTSNSVMVVVDNIQESIKVEENEAIQHGVDSDKEPYILMPCYVSESKKQVPTAKGKGNQPEKKVQKKKNDETVLVPVDEQIYVKNGFACQVQLSQTAMFTAKKTPYRMIQLLDVWAKKDENGNYWFQCNNVTEEMYDSTEGDNFTGFTCPKSSDQLSRITRRVFQLGDHALFQYPIRDTFEKGLMSVVPVPSSNVAVIINEKPVRAINIKYSNSVGTVKKGDTEECGDEMEESDESKPKQAITTIDVNYPEVEIKDLTKSFKIIEKSEDIVDEETKQNGEDDVPTAPVNDFSGSLVINQETEFESVSYGLGFSLSETGDWKKKEGGSSGKNYNGNRFMVGITDRNKYKGFFICNRLSLLFFTKKTRDHYFGAKRLGNGTLFHSANLKYVPILANIQGHVERCGLRIPNAESGLLKMICSDENILTYKDDPDLIRGRYSKLTFLVPEKADSVSWLFTYPDEQNKTKPELQKGNPLNFDPDRVFLNLAECTRDPSRHIDAREPVTNAPTNCIGYCFSYVGDDPNTLEEIYETSLPKMEEVSMLKIFELNEKIFADPKRTKDEENEQYFWNIVLLLFTFWTYAQKTPLYKLKDFKKKSKYLTAVNNVIATLIPKYMGHREGFKYSFPENDEMYDHWTGMAFIPYLFPNPEVLVVVEKDKDRVGGKRKIPTDVPDQLPDPSKQTKK